jgi:hypothetical protein
MREFAALKYDGVFSIGWVLAWGIGHYFLLRRGIYFDQFRLLFLGIWALWWGGGLLFAIPAVRRGSPLNMICGLGTVIAFVCFLWLLIFPRVHFHHNL